MSTALEYRRIITSIESIREYSSHKEDVQIIRDLIFPFSISDDEICIIIYAKKLREALARQNEEICQTLGKALGYPWFKDDQVNFPGATEKDGVCVGEHTAESIAEEAATKIRQLQALLTPSSTVVERTFK